MIKSYSHRSDKTPLLDYRGQAIAIGVVARSITGYRTNKEGRVIEIDENVGNITLEFEDKEIGIYLNDKITVF